MEIMTDVKNEKAFGDRLAAIKDKVADRVEERKDKVEEKKAEVKEKKTNLDEDFQASAARLEELKAGRTLGDIPMGDDYFKAVRKHMAAHNPLTNKKES